MLARIKVEFHYYRIQSALDWILAAEEEEEHKNKAQGARDEAAVREQDEAAKAAAEKARTSFVIRYAQPFDISIPALVQTSEQSHGGDMGPRIW